MGVRSAVSHSQVLSASLWASASRSLWNTHRKRERDTEFTFNYSLTSQGQISRACLQLKQQNDTATVAFERGWLESSRPPSVTISSSALFFKHPVSPQCQNLYGPEVACILSRFHNFMILMLLFFSIDIMWLSWESDRRYQRILCAQAQTWPWYKTKQELPVKLSLMSSLSAYTSARPGWVRDAG